MGRTYLFECPQCHYRARISGGADSGIHCEIQTVVCRDCRELFDVFIRQRRREGASDMVRFHGFYRPEIPPSVLPDPERGLVWRSFEPACPVVSPHFVEPWNDPGRCPRCGNFMEKNGIPFRLWD